MLSRENVNFKTQQFLIITAIRRHTNSVTRLEPRHVTLTLREEVTNRLAIANVPAILPGREAAGNSLAKPRCNPGKLTNHV